MVITGGGPGRTDVQGGTASLKDGCQHKAQSSACTQPDAA